MVIDIGINVKRRGGETSSILNKFDDGTSSDYQVVGDVDLPQVQSVASAVTPVPGGVGPMTIAALLHNVVLAARYRAGLSTW